MSFKYGVQIGKYLAIRAACFQFKMNAGCPGFFSFFYGNHLIGQYFDRLFVFLDLPLNQHGFIEAQPAEAAPAPAG